MLKVPELKKLKWYIACAVMIIVACIAAHIYFGYAKRVDLTPMKKVFAYAEGEEFKPVGKASDKAPGMTPAAENDSLALYIDENTAEIAVVDKKSGAVYFSNPKDRMQDDVANQANKDMLSSQIIIKYFDKHRKENIMNSYADSVAKGQFVISSIKNGVRVTYTMGELKTDADRLPRFITPERFQEKLLGKLDAESAKLVRKQYVESPEKQGFLELRQNAVKSRIILGQLMEVFEKAGYTEEDLAYDNEMSGGGSGGEERPSFTITVDYVLDGGDLVVTVPAGRIEENQSGKLAVLELLRYFGAAGTEDEGYMVVPSGSGALINLNNGKISSDPYVQQVYALDPVVVSYYQTQIIEPVRMPVFGMKKNRNAWFAIIEDGDALASVRADISGRVNSYNYVYSYFTLRDDELLSMFGVTGSEADLPVVDNKMYDGNISVRYTFLGGEDANYSGMARFYQDYLARKNILRKISDDRRAPFYLDILGGVQKRVAFMGIPYRTTYAMTTFKEAGLIMDELEARGVGNIRMRFLGWFNDGYYHDVAKKVHIEGTLGGKSDLLSLDERLKNSGGALYPDVAFQKVSYTSSSFMPIFEASRYISGLTVTLAPYNRATLRMNTRFREAVYHIQSPAALPRVIDRFTASFARTGLDSVSLRDLGDILASDKKRRRPVDREFAKNICISQISRINEVAGDMMISGGNVYSLAWADELVDVPVSSNNFYITDEEIPFYQMVIHGFIDYTGAPFNLDSGYDIETMKLKMLEYGFAPRFVLTYKDTSKLKNTSLEFMYSTHYKTWIDEAARIYNDTADVLAGLRKLRMAEHVKHKPGVCEMKYEDGTSLIVNYNDEAAEINGVVVEAGGYAVKGGGAF
ncbi:MAG: DUF5696 domain-containing protein [Acetivibrionales bacterium]